MRLLDGNVKIVFRGVGRQPICIVAEAFVFFLIVLLKRNLTTGSYDIELE